MTALAVRHELGDHLAQLTAAYLATPTPRPWLRITDIPTNQSTA